MQYQSLEEETDMKLLEERIQRDGIVREGNVLKLSLIHISEPTRRS